MAGACGSDGESSTPAAICTSDPWSCGAGKTCWATSGAGDFQCQAAGTKQKGEACSPLVGPGAPIECGESMMCFTLDVTVPGSCLPFCSPDRPERGCGADELCVPVLFGANRVPAGSLCFPMTPAVDGGGGAPGADGGTAGSAGTAAG
jgi:hypothetical protein